MWVLVRLIRVVLELSKKHTYVYVCTYIYIYMTLPKAITCWGYSAPTNPPPGPNPQLSGGPGPEPSLGHEA